MLLGCLRLRLLLLLLLPAELLAQQLDLTINVGKIDLATSIILL
jgi:hypothetical protein